MRTFFRAVTLAFLAVLLTTTTAFADGGFPPEIGGGGTEPGTSDGGISPGGQSTPTPAPEGTSWSYGGTPLTPEAFAWNQGAGSISVPTQGGSVVNGSCNPGLINGDRDWTATGATWSFLLDDETGAYAGQYGYSCAIPPKPQDVQVRCVERIQAVITQELDPASQRTLRDKSITTPWAADRTSPAKCGVSATISTQAPMDRLGGYLFRLTGTSYPCTQRSYPGTNRPTRIVRCGAAATTTKSLKGALWCAPGVPVDWALGDASWDHNFTWAACSDQANDLVDCQLDAQAPTFAGRLADNASSPVQVLDDGVLQPLRFSPLKPTGPIESISNIFTSVKVSPGSTPYRAGAFVDGNTQPFRADGGFGASSGDTTVWPTAYYAAGVPGAPWVARKVSTFDARVHIRTVTVQQIDFDTMAAVTSTQSTVVDAKGLTCQSPNAYVAVYRARNTT